MTLIHDTGASQQLIVNWRTTELYIAKPNLSQFLSISDTCILYWYWIVLLTCILGIRNGSIPIRHQAKSISQNRQVLYLIMNLRALLGPYKQGKSPSNHQKGKVEKLDLNDPNENLTTLTCIQIMKQLTPQKFRLSIMALFLLPDWVQLLVQGCLYLLPYGRPDVPLQHFQKLINNSMGKNHGCTPEMYSGRQ